MKPHDDLGEFRAGIHVSWSAYAWIMIIFAVIALSGRLIGQYLQH